MRARLLLSLGTLLLTGCASLSLTEKPVLALLPYGDATGSAAKVAEAFNRAVSSRYLVKTPVSLYAQTAMIDQAEATETAARLKAGRIATLDVLPVGPDSVRVYVRLIEVATGARSGFSTELSLSRQEGWAWSLARLIAEPARGQWSEAAKDWDSSLDQALRSGDYDEALRLADLLEAKNPQHKGLRVLIEGQSDAAREAADAQNLMDALGQSRGSARVEALRPIEFLNQLRQTAVTSDAGLRPQVAAAFRTSFGGELTAALNRPPLVFVKRGTYSMGSIDELDEGPIHGVTVTDLLVGSTEITQEQYTAVMGSNPSLFTQANDAPRRPVERVTWYDAVEFCNKLSLLEGLQPVYTIQKTEVSQDRTKTGYRLPTEAEWEWIARGGIFATGSTLSGGGDPALVGWMAYEAGGPSPVAEKQPNELGIFDLSGNVWEWCSDWYGRYDSPAVTDPTGPALGILKVGRGGSWHAAPWNARVTSRSFDNPGSKSSNLGFRVVRSLSPP